MSIAKPIIVVGCPRSGTTLTGRLIGSHCQVGYLEESRLICTIASHCDVPLDHGTLEDLLAALWINTVLSPRDMDFNGGKYLLVHGLPKTQTTVKKYRHLVPDAYIADGVARYEALPGRDVLFGMLNEFADRMNVARVLEKTNANRHCLAFIQECLRDAKIVAVLRDPRDVRASQRNWHQVEIGIRQGHRSLDYLIDDWRAFSTSVIPASAFLLRYEDLVDDFRTTLEKLFGFCELAIDEGVRQYMETEQGRLHRLSVRRHIQDLSRDEQVRIEAQLGDEMRKHGYLP